MVIIRRILEGSEIKMVLNTFDKSFPRTLSSRIGNLSDYANKLSENAIIIVAEDNGSVIGFAAMYANDSVLKQAFLSQIAVSIEYIGKNIGKLLLEACEKLAIENGMKMLRLEVDKTNERAINFYIKYRYVTEITNDISCIMVKSLHEH